MRSRRAALPILLAILASCSGPAPDATHSAAASPSPTATPDPARPLPLPLPDVVARVNGQDIRIQQILPLARTLLSRMPASERDTRKPEAVRNALDTYVARELLLQEALARGIAADSRQLESSYDQLRRDHAAEAEWAEFLAQQGLDAQSIKAELRVQHTVAALVAREVAAWPVPEAEARAAYADNPGAFTPPGAQVTPPFEEIRAEVERAVREHKSAEIQAALVQRLRARARIELFI